jgi:hypothetical protein
MAFLLGRCLLLRGTDVDRFTPSAERAAWA